MLNFKLYAINSIYLSIELSVAERKACYIEISTRQWRFKYARTILKLNFWANTVFISLRVTSNI